jgi:hypothetical protein
MTMKLISRINAALFAAVASASLAYGADVNIAHNTVLTGSVNWTADNVYHLQGFAFVDDGATLNIQAGTIIKGSAGTGNNDFGCLFVERGGKLMALGTAESPIIFTAETDTLNWNLGIYERGLWGGIVVLGKANLNSAANATGNANSQDGNPATVPFDVYEGLSNPLPETESNGRFTYGGTDDADNSGVIRYVVIKHGGKIFTTNKEVNGLSLCAVGSGTVVEYVECYAIQDDGFEWFGGTVNNKYLVSAFNDDEAFDTDQGFRGKNQFLFSIQDPLARDRGSEINGFVNGSGSSSFALMDRAPQATYQVFNATWIGGGVQTATVGGFANNTFRIRDGSRVKFYNSIFTDYAERGIALENVGTNFLASDTALSPIALDHNLWFGFSSGATGSRVINNTIANIAINSGTNTPTALFSAPWDNQIVDPALGGINRGANRTLDPVPSSVGPAFTGTTQAIPADGWYDTTATYKGAFGPGDYWMDGWTTLSRRGILKVNKILSEVTYNAGLDQATIRWASVLNATYQVQSSTDGVTWTNEGGSVTGTGGTGTGFDASTTVALGGTKKFLRVTGN